MDLHPTDDQAAIVAASIDWLEARLPLAAARARPADSWAGLADMGWLGMTGPDMGLDHATEALVFAELGRFLAPLAALSSAVAARWMGGDGKVALALASGGRLRVLDTVGAGSALATTVGGASLLPLPAGLADAECLDLTLRQAVIEPPAATRSVDDVRPHRQLMLLAAAYAVGAADAARDMAAGYAQIREQFGKPIGAFQGVKHPCADMAVRCAVARSQLYFAACALDAAAPDAGFHIAAAKRLADRAALDNARATIQVHGGIGMTDDALPHLLLKRAHLLGFVAPVTTADLLADAG